MTLIDVLVAIALSALVCLWIHKQDVREERERAEDEGLQ